MSTITLELEDEVLANLQRLAKQKGTTPEDLLAESARSMSVRRSLPLHPLLRALDDLPATGQTTQTKSESESYYEYMEERHQ